MLNENGAHVDAKRDILAEIAQKTRERIAVCKQTVSLEQMQQKANESADKEAFAFEKALRGQGMSFICEVKKASPSKGIIAQEFPYVEIAKAYEAAGAQAISCLTEPYYFQGENEFLREIAQAVPLPILRKDFFVDEYMIYEAKVLGADAVLLICAILEDEALTKYFAIAQRLGLSCVFEAHTQSEVRRAVACGARVIGVNNRNLKTFQLDLCHSIALRNEVPDEVIFVSESGIATPQDIGQLLAHKIDAVLIGETLMRAQDKKQMLDYLRNANG